MLKNIFKIDTIYHYAMILMVGLSFGHLDTMQDFIVYHIYLIICIAFVTFSMQSIMMQIFKHTDSVLSGMVTPILVFIFVVYTAEIMNVVAELTICWFFALCIFLFKGFKNGFFTSFK